MEAASAAAVADAATATLPATHAPVDARGLALAVLATLATVFALSWAQTFLVPLLLGVVITYTLSPVVYWLERLRIPRVVGTVLVMASCRRGPGPERVFAAWTGADHHRAAADRKRRKLSASLAELQKSQRGNLQKIQSAASDVESATATAVGGTRRVSRPRT
ncbi:MAG: hypothetical protein MZW92_23760 [Comamonadaceae bacterium]|nr:hypothetical protein [Comamonadaceae bacterium]